LLRKVGKENLVSFRKVIFSGFLKGNFIKNMTTFIQPSMHFIAQHNYKQRNAVDTSVDISTLCVNELHNNKYRDYDSKVATPVLINLRVGESVQLHVNCAGVLEKIWVTITHIDEEYDDEGY